MSEMEYDSKIYGKFLIPFDVTSLFTNISLEGTINITIHAIF